MKSVDDQIADIKARADRINAAHMKRLESLLREAGQTPPDRPSTKATLRLSQAQRAGADGA